MNANGERSAGGGRRTVYLETFGCQMNVLDSQLVRGQLEGLGYGFIDDWKSADVVLYNTCSVRERAEQKVWSRIGEVGVYKRRHPDLVLGVIGCMAEREGEALLHRHPQVDLMCGPGELDKVAMLIDNALKTAAHLRRGRGRQRAALQGNTHRRSATLGAAEDRLEMLDLSRSMAPDDGASAYVRITRGCNKYCTYCVVPATRGREIHRPPDHIVEECRRLVDAGAAEITLLGQTVNHYHYDRAAAVTIDGVAQPQIGTVLAPNRGTGGPSPVFGPRVTSFARLLARIHDEIPRLARLRFVTSFPRDFGDDILEVIRDRRRICRYLHLPVQSGSNRILKLMNRGYTVEQYLDLVDRVRRVLPDAQLASDLICGFPTETDEDHAATADLLRRCRFKNCFIFKYSPRPGTAAIERHPDDVPDEVKKRRNNELLAIQARISAGVHAAFVGRTAPVLVESVSSRQRKADRGGGGSVELGWSRSEADGRRVQLTGRTDGDLIVCFEGEESLIGRIVDVRVESSAPLVLFGSLLEQPAAV